MIPRGPLVPVPVLPCDPCHEQLGVVALGLDEEPGGRRPSQNASPSPSVQDDHFVTLHREAESLRSRHAPIMANCSGDFPVRDCGLNGVSGPTR